MFQGVMAGAEPLKTVSGKVKEPGEEHSFNSLTNIVEETSSSRMHPLF